MALHNWSIVIVAPEQLDRSSFQRLLERDKTTGYDIIFAALLSEAIEHVRVHPVDAMLVSLANPDPRFPAAVRQVTSTRPDMPVLVVYRGDDDGFPEQCRNGGAAEVLQYKQLSAMSLRLAVSAMIGRRRMSALKLAERRSAAYQIVAEALVNGWLTATQGWDPLLRKSRPDKFSELVEAYEQVLGEWVRNKREGKRQSRAPLRHIGNMFEQLSAGPADVADVHAHALAKMVRGIDQAKARGAAWLAHGLALDVIGRLQVVKDRAPWARQDPRRTSSLNFQRSSDTSSLRRTSDIGILRRTSDVTKTRRRSDLTYRDQVSGGFQPGGQAVSGIVDNPFVKGRRKSDLVLDVDGRKIEYNG